MCCMDEQGENKETREFVMHLIVSPQVEFQGEFDCLSGTRGVCKCSEMSLNQGGY